MVAKDNMSGNCYVCDFYNKETDECRKASNVFGGLNDPICLQKLTVIILRDIANMLSDYIYGEDD